MKIRVEIDVYTTSTEYEPEDYAGYESREELEAYIMQEIEETMEFFIHIHGSDLDELWEKSRASS